MPITRMEERSLNLAPSPADARMILRLEGVNKWYHRGTLRNTHVLKDINLEVSRGEVLVVIGPSGSGKSTLLRCINFVAPPETGTVVFLGRKWTKDNVPLNPIERIRYERELNVLRTHIGIGSPNKQDTSKAHGEALGEDEIKLTKRNLGWPSEEPFYVPEEALAHWRKAGERGAAFPSDHRERSGGEPAAGVSRQESR